MNAKVEAKIISVGDKKRAVVGVQWKKGDRLIHGTAFGEGNTDEEAKRDLLQKVPGLAGVVAAAVEEFAATPSTTDDGAVVLGQGSSNQKKVDNLLGVAKQIDGENGNVYRKRLFDMVDTMQLDVKKEGKTEDFVVAVNAAIVAKYGSTDIEMTSRPAF